MIPVRSHTPIEWNACAGIFEKFTGSESYISSYPFDAMSPMRNATFIYWSAYPGKKDPAGRTYSSAGGHESPYGGVGWILVSAGPDHDYDLADEYEVYNPAINQPSKRLLAGTNRRGSAFTYDPTNGTISDGDMWRIKQ